MYLKCIRANGFKSFADKIELDINKGITGIVGPNGSGKSNIVDAIRWVLGEQSVKALRGDSSMIDCIFAGSKTRSPLSRAWVSLTFDNTDHYLNSEFNELEIKRVVYKTGENEYYINNTKVRLKDITDLFLDSGAGKESFNIISQGQVADVVNSKPEDRRIIFEEAAGVLKYKKRKEESLRKLDKTNENLARVNLLIDEILTTLEPLKEQSSKAEEYLNYKEQLQNIDIALMANDIEKINNESEQVKEHIYDLNKELNNLTINNNIDTSKVEQLKLEQLKLDTSIEEKNTKLNELINESSNLQSKKQIAIERQKYKVEDSKIENNLISLKEEILELNKEVNNLTKALDNTKVELDSKQLKNIEIIKQYENKKEEKTKTTNDLNIINKELLSLNNKIDILKENINNDTKLPYSVKSVLNNIRLKGIHNVLNKLINTDELYSTAIEISLGANNNVIIVDDEKSAKQAINYLKENKLGRATFFPLSVIKGRSIPYDDLSKARELEGYIGTANELVKCDSKYQEIILNQLGNVLVVNNIDTLNKLGKKLNYKYKIVTLDGEILYSGGAITGGTGKNNGPINQKFELENLNKEYQEKQKKAHFTEEKLSKIETELNKLSLTLETNQKEVILLTEEYNLKESNLNNLKTKLDNKTNEYSGTENLKNGSIEEELDNILKEYYDIEQQKEELSNTIAKLKSTKNDLNNEILELEKAYKDQNSKISSKQNELKLEEIKLGKMDVKLDNMLLNLNEIYGMTYEKAHEEYLLDIDEETARLTVNNLKVKIKNLGEVNTGSIAEYNRLNERYEFLTKQRDDLSTSITSLLNVIEEMDEIMKDKFNETFEKIKVEFSKVFKKLFKGGDGILELTNETDLLSTGIEISALPPGKKLNSVGLLSGGEKTLTAIALLFAILNVKPVPFVVLDEVEAALDEANVDAFGEYLKFKKENSQFIIITHKKRTMEYTDVLYGITMQESGVSKLVSVKLED